MLANKPINWKDLTNLLPTKSRYQGWRILSIIVVGLATAAAIITAYFIYQNIFRTLENANAVVILSSNLNIDVIDTKAYNQTEELIKAKNTLFVWPKDVRNIFSYQALTTTYVTTTKR